MSKKQSDKTGEKRPKDESTELDDIAPDASDADKVTGGLSGESKPLQVKVG